MNQTGMQAEQKNGQIPEQLERLCSTVSRIEEGVKRLTNKLNSIRSGIPEPIEESAPAPVLCPLAELLRNYQQRLSTVSDFISILTNTIEL